MKVQFKVPFFETYITSGYTGEVIDTDGEYSKIRYKNDSGVFKTTWIKTSELIELK